MRDRRKLWTVIVVPKEARDAPILQTLKPHAAKKNVERTLSAYAVATGLFGERTMPGQRQASEIVPP